MNGTYANIELQGTIRQEEQHDPTDLVISQWLGPFSPRARSIQDHWHYRKQTHIRWRAHNLINTRLPVVVFIYHTLFQKPC